MKIKAILTVMLSVLMFSFTAGAADLLYFYHTDPVGTPMAMTDASGAVVWKADYKPFGEENSITGSATNNKRFVGKEKDVETGLDYFGARYMNNKIGRFTSVDPVAAVDEKASKTNEKQLLNPQRLNAYVYTLNNPYRYVDPDGRDLIDAEPSRRNDIPHVSGGLNGSGPGNFESLRSGGAATSGGAGSSGTAVRPYFPTNNGVIGSTTTKTLYPGEMVDRYGGSSASRFFSPPGTPAGARALPPGTTNQPLRTFEVVKPFPVEAGTVAPAYGQLGLGTQYRTPTSLETLLNRGILREVKK